jgi:hypothetical protein
MSVDMVPRDFPVEIGASTMMPSRGKLMSICARSLLLTELLLCISNMSKINRSSHSVPPRTIFSETKGYRQMVSLQIYIMNFSNVMVLLSSYRY